MANPGLQSRIRSYAQTIPAPDTSSWREKINSWSTFAAVTGSALALASNASASIIYSGAVDLTLSVNTAAGHHVVSNKTFKVNGQTFNLFLTHTATHNGQGSANLGNLHHTNIGAVLNPGSSLKRLASGALISRVMPKRRSQS